MVDKVKHIIANFEAKNQVKIGMATAAPKKIHHTIPPFMAFSKEERRDPTLYLPGAKSIIVMLMPLQYMAEKPTSMAGRGVLSTDGVGIDYHILLRDKLEHLWKIIIEHKALSHYTGAIFVDTGPLVERDIAYEAKLGVYGKSGHLISPVLGVYCYIGYIISDIPYFQIEQGKWQRDICANCSLCVAHCPGGALGDGFNYSRCASYITQKKENLSPCEASILGHQIYGCDICRDICPYNLNLGEVVETDIIYPYVADFLGYNNRAFKEKFKNRGFIWRGRSIIERNIETILNNQQREK